MNKIFSVKSNSVEASENAKLKEYIIKQRNEFVKEMIKNLDE